MMVRRSGPVVNAQRAKPMRAARARANRMVRSMVVGGLEVAMGGDDGSVTLHVRDGLLCLLDE